MAYYKATKQHIKYLFISKPAQTSKILEVTVITDADVYVEYQFQFKQNKMTYSIAERLKSFFADWLIDINTDICYMDDYMDESNPFVLYVTIVHQHILFNFKRVSYANVIRRIGLKTDVIPHNTDFSSTRLDVVKKVWNRVVQLGRCPWITKELTYQIKSMPYERQKQAFRLRLCAYYMAMKGARNS